jgi:hypothetical protein
MTPTTTPLALPTRTTLPDSVHEKFAEFTTKMRKSLKPRDPEELAICDQITIATWNFKRNRALANALERQIKRTENPTPEIQLSLRHHTNQAHRQRNFAWRRRMELSAARKLAA